MAKGKKIPKISLIEVDDDRIKKTVDIYFHWKDLDTEIRTLSTRGVIFPSELSENFVCYACNLKLNKGSAGDAIDEKTNRVYEIKGASSLNNDDLSSFSPTEKFDELIFAKLNRNEDKLYIYFTGIDSNELKKIKVNKTETLEDKQKKGNRPRFSIIKKIINVKDIKPMYIFNIRDCTVTPCKN